MKTKPPKPKNFFNSAAISPAKMRVIKKYHDPHTGARLVCAELPAFYASMTGLKTGAGLKMGANSKTKPIFMVGWIPAGRVRIVESTFYRTKATAIKHFLAREKTATPPDHQAFTHDWQRSKVYRWEEDNTNKNNLTLDFNRIAMVASRVTQDFGLPPIKLHVVYPPPNPAIYGYYFQQEHCIELHNLRYSILLHELAHAIDYRINGNNSSVFHGPSFLRTLLCLAELYCGFDMEKMERALAEDKLKIAPLDALPALKARIEALKNPQPTQLKLP